MLNYVPPMTPTEQLAEMILGEPVRDWIEKRRARGTSWRFIARDLYESTSGRIDVTHETLRNWVAKDAA